MNNYPDMKEIFLTECSEQPKRLADVFRSYATDPEVRCELEHAKQSIRVPQPLVWLGMGASYCSSIAGATRYTLAGNPSFPVEASEWLHYAPATWGKVGGPILMTTSGESAELVELCRQNAQRPRILICNSPESSCWQDADIRLPILAGIENGNATNSYTNCAAVSSILAAELLGQPWQIEAAQVESALARSLEHAFGERREIESFCRGVETLEIMGRGAALGGALMGALCVREMTAWRVHAHSSGAFRHGPFLDVDSGHAAVILALGRTCDLGRGLARDCIAKGGKAVLVVDRDPVESGAGLLTIKLEPVPESWEGLTSVLVPQALTLALIERLGSRYVRLNTTVQ